MLSLFIKVPSWGIGAIRGKTLERDAQSVLFNLVRKGEREGRKEREEKGMGRKKESLR